MFMTLEDETGNVQVIVWPDLREDFRKEVYGSRLLVVEGHWQDREGSFNLIAKRFENLTHLVDDLETRSRDFQ